MLGFGADDFEDVGSFGCGELSPTSDSSELESSRTGVRDLERRLFTAELLDCELFDDELSVDVVDDASGSVCGPLAAQRDRLLLLVERQENPFCLALLEELALDFSTPSDLRLLLWRLVMEFDFFKGLDTGHELRLLGEFTARRTRMSFLPGGECTELFFAFARFALTRFLCIPEGESRATVSELARRIRTLPAGIGDDEESGTVNDEDEHDASANEDFFNGGEDGGRSPNEEVREGTRDMTAKSAAKARREKYQE